MAKTVSVKSVKYWRERSEYLQERLLEKGDDFCREAAAQFDRAIVNIEKEISAFYTRFADNNKISYTDAQRILTTAERNAYCMDVKAYIERGRTLNYSNEWAHALENASTAHRVTRLQALQTQMRQQVETVYGMYDKGLTETAADILSEGYYRNIYEIQKGYGQGNPFTQLNTAKAERIIAKPWAPDGHNFSEKLWGDRDKLLHSLDAKLTQAFIRGDDVHKIVNDIAGVCGVSKSNAMRLIQTEAAYFSAAAKHESYQALSMKQYQIVATLDSRTSDICQGMDGEVFDLERYEPGITANPFHPWCRSTTAPYFEDETGPRTARGMDGKSYEVPGNITYQEWRNGLTEDQNKSLRFDKKTYENRRSDEKQYRKYKAVFGDDFPNTFADFQVMKYNDGKDSSERWAAFKVKKQETLNALDYQKLFDGLFGDIEVRQWYIAHDEAIASLLDATEPLEAQARKAHELRNRYRTQARNMMANQEKRRILDTDNPNPTFEQTMERKRIKYGLTGDEAYVDAIRSSQTTNIDVNKKIGLGE